MRIVQVKALVRAMILVVLFGYQSQAAMAAEGGASNYLHSVYGNFGVAIAPAPGTYFQNDLFYYTGDVSTAVLSGQVNVALETNIIFDLVTGLWVPDVRLLGAQYAAGIFVPMAHADLKGTATLPFIGPVSRSTDKFDIGDIAFMPVSLFWTLSDSFHVNLYEVITTPTGGYSTNRFLNIGRNYFSFDTVLSMTWMNQATGTEISVVPGIMVNTENTATDYTTGVEFHMDWMVNQFFSETFAVGVHGFVYRQISGDSGSGAVLGDFKGKSNGVGPALMWVPVIGKTPVKFVAKAMFEFGAKRRFEGTYGQL